MPFSLINEQAKCIEGVSPAFNISYLNGRSVS